MTILLLRHVDAGDRAAWRGDDRQRPASGRGHAQAAALVEVLRDALGDLPLVGTWTSPYRRCVDSVAPLATAAGTEVEVHDELSEGTPPDVAGRLLRRAARAAAEADGAVVLCSHGDVIGDAVTRWLHRGLLTRQDARWPKGSTWLVTDLAGDPQVRYLPPPAVR